MASTESKHPFSLFNNFYRTGSVTLLDHNGGTVERGIAPAAKKTASTFILAGSPVTAGEKGAVFITLEVATEQAQPPFSTMEQVESENILPDTPFIPTHVTNLDLPFIKVEKLSWASDGCKLYSSRKW